MKIYNGKIISCTENELWNFWFERWSDFISYDEYKRKVRQNGTKVRTEVKTKNGYKVVKSNKIDGLTTKTLTNGFIKKNKWIKVSTDKGTKFQCPKCEKIFYCNILVGGYRKKRTICNYRYCPYCGYEPLLQDLRGISK